MAPPRVRGLLRAALPTWSADFVHKLNLIGSTHYTNLTDFHRTLAEKVHPNLSVAASLYGEGTLGDPAAAVDPIVVELNDGRSTLRELVELLSEVKDEVEKPHAQVFGDVSDAASSAEITLAVVQEDLQRNPEEVVAKVADSIADIERAGSWIGKAADLLVRVFESINGETENLAASAQGGASAATTHAPSLSPLAQQAFEALVTTHKSNLAQAYARALYTVEALDDLVADYARGRVPDARESTKEIRTDVVHARNVCEKVRAEFEQLRREKPDWKRIIDLDDLGNRAEVELGAVFSALQADPAAALHDGQRVQTSVRRGLTYLGRMPLDIAELHREVTQVAAPKQDPEVLGVIETKESDDDDPYRHSRWG